MGAEKINGQKKFLYGVMAAILFFLVLWVFAAIFKLILASSHWVELVADVDHRMQPSKFNDINSDSIRSPLEANDVEGNGFNIILSIFCKRSFT